MKAVEKILKDAAFLPEDQKLSLANKILASTEPLTTRKLDNEWDMEIRDRIEKYDKGFSSSRPAAEVFSKLDKQLNS